MFAEWIADSGNPFWKTGVLNSTSSVIELGCGISGLTGLVLAPSISKYVLSDQSYVSRFVESNLKENIRTLTPNASGSRRKGKAALIPSKSNVNFTALDWELDEVTSDLTGSVDRKSFDVVIACDCIYNEALIRPLVQTCVDLCKLRRTDGAVQGPAICIVAQQLRNPEIFEEWITDFHQQFQTWRIPESALTKELRSNAGFVIHIGILRETR